MSTSILIDNLAASVPVAGSQSLSPSVSDARISEVRVGDESARDFQLLTESQVLQLMIEHSRLYDTFTMTAPDCYSSDAFILRTAAHNHMVHESIPPGSCVMLDPDAEVAENTMMAYALVDQNTIAIGIRDDSWDGYFISLGDRAVHINDKRCIPLCPAVAVIGYDL